jgi:outer membrane immunogenic protein
MELVPGSFLGLGIMRKTIACLLSSAAAIGFAGAAFAADMPVKAPVIAQTVYNWTGFYAGVNAGYGGGMKDWSGINYAAHGPLAGVQFGGNQQVGNLVFGVEADLAWSGMKGTVTQQIAVPFSVSDFHETFATKIDSVATAAGRLGIAVDRWLVYGKAGMAWAYETQTRSNISTVAGVPGAQTVLIAGTETRKGPMLGIGAEYAFLGNWSVKAEYDYLDFVSPSRVDLSGTLTSLAGTTTNVRTFANIPERLHIAKVGLNYRLGPDGPPAIAPAMPSRSYNWTGVYAGIEAAGGWETVGFVGFAPFDAYDVKGWLGGAVVGARVQPSVFVAGVEAEWMGGRMTGGRSDITSLTVANTTTQTLATRLDQIAMATAQFGFLPTDRLLVYLKGGVALAHARHTENFSFIAAPGGTSSIFLNEGGVWHTGGVAGVGAEYAFLGNWSAKLEYDYIALTPQNIFLPGTVTEISQVLGTGTTSLPTSATLRGTGLQLIKFGINYRFGPELVSAKY